MPTVTIEVPVELPADLVFAQLVEADGLAPFLSEPVRSQACRGTPRFDRAARRLVWGERDAERGGQVSVVDSRPGSCAVSLELRTEATDENLLRTELQRAVASLAQRALVSDSTVDTGRAWH
jgi:hypothetical protein